MRREDVGNMCLRIKRICCSMLQCIAQCVTVRDSTLRSATVRDSSVQCIAVCRRVSQRLAL